MTCAVCGPGKLHYKNGWPACAYRSLKRTRKPDRRPARAPRDGYRRKSKDGYIQVYSDGRWLMEHRQVMEQVLGRSLDGGENVHHKNGVRNDNRPENLELWVTSQPAGQRPEDLVVWAREILKKYA